ncbi:MAG TPA: PASTA domain-containing protein [Candidatus Deferrimicrobium sp.]|nr:PASTA domain-containing protein [Candidatus Deferrimicrobium sp.]
MPLIPDTELEVRPARRYRTWLNRQLPYGTLKRKIVLWAIVPFFVLLSLYWLFDDVIMMAVTRQGSDFPLPDYIGQRLFEAQFELENLNLGHEISSREYSAGKEKGIILSQYPPPGTRVKPGRTIKLVMSLGQKMVPIPDVAGKSVRQATLDLETAGLILGEIAWALSDTLPERVVVFSYPNAGTEVPLGSAVNLMVNRGRALNFTYVPRVIGLTVDEARTRLEEKYLKVGVITYRTDENYLPETVLEQSEPEGAELDVGTEIDLVVSSTD